jgi:hypothetical protein
MLAELDERVPVLERIVETPFFTPEFTLRATPGYDQTSRVLYVPASGFSVPPVPERPSPTDIDHAKELILVDLLGDFPFVGDAERAHAVALFLLPFVRQLIDGPTPLHLVEKSTPGTGATLLVQASLYPAIGRAPSAMTEARDEEEWRKRITATLMTLPTIVFIDNLGCRLQSAALSSAITTTAWEDRVLGHSDTVRLKVRCVWVATGNNPVLSNELTRRTIRIRLDAKMDRPWEREGFRHPNLLDWVRQNRAQLVWAALALGQAWIAAGKPEGKQVLGMFESWARVVGGILEVAGIAGFLQNRSAFYETADTQDVAIRDFLRSWWSQYKAAAVRPRDLLTLAKESDAPLDLEAKSEQGQRVKFGRLLLSLRDRVYRLGDGLSVRVEQAGKENNASLWRLSPQTSGGGQGSLSWRS